MILKKILSIVSAIVILMTLVFKQTATALPKYCNYFTGDSKCCSGTPINCTDIDPDNPDFDKFCNGGTVMPISASCSY